jgi:hypothetical protein
MGLELHTCSLSTWEAEMGESQIWGHPGLHDEFQGNALPQMYLCVCVCVCINR